MACQAGGMATDLPFLLVVTNGLLVCLVHSSAPIICLSVDSRSVFLTCCASARVDPTVSPRARFRRPLRPSFLPALGDPGPASDASDSLPDRCMAASPAPVSVTPSASCLPRAWTAYSPRRVPSVRDTSPSSPVSIAMRQWHSSTCTQGSPLASMKPSRVPERLLGGALLFHGSPTSIASDPCSPWTCNSRRICCRRLLVHAYPAPCLHRDLQNAKAAASSSKLRRVDRSKSLSSSRSSTSPLVPDFCEKRLRRSASSSAVASVALSRRTRPMMAPKPELFFLPVLLLAGGEERGRRSGGSPV